MTSNNARGLARSRRAYLIALVVIIAVLIDRIAWASVSQWREDQASNLWLGYTRGPLETPIGLLSSTTLPNPNGMVLVAFPLSRLPTPWYVSSLLGFVTAALLAWVAWLIFGGHKLHWIVAGPLLTSIILRSMSVEFTQQWILTPLDLLFVAGVLLYVRRPTPWLLPLAVVLSLGSASIYLAGAANAAAFAALTAILFIARKGDWTFRSWRLPVLASIVVVVVSIGLTWAPYLQIVGAEGIRSASTYAGTDASQRLSGSLGSIARLPWWTLAQPLKFGHEHLLPPLQVDDHILRPRTFSAFQISQWLAAFQGFLAYVALAVGAVTAARRRSPVLMQEPAARWSPGLALALVAAFVALLAALTPLLGGPNWSEGQRLDQAAQLMPFLMIIWFGLPYVLALPSRLRRAAVVITLANSIAFSALSLVVGAAVVQQNLSYRGGRLPADVPLVQKLDAARFIAEDWTSHSTSSQVAVDYDLAGETWAWLPEFGLGYLEWYPAPYTIGRIFDFLLLRQYGLTNLQEGTQLRTFGTGRYLLTYSFQPRPELEGHDLRHVRFGRLRVTVVQDR